MSKEVKPKEKASREPKQLSFDPNEFFQNTLALPTALKDSMTAQGLDWRFINANEFKKNGGVHHAHWKPYKVDRSPDEVGLFSLSPEGYVQRGDLILGVRPKAITQSHKAFLKRRNEQYQAFNKEKAKELRKHFQSAGLGSETTIHEGYEDPGQKDSE